MCNNEQSVAPTLLRRATSISGKGSQKMLFLDNCHLNFCSSLKVLIWEGWEQFVRLWITAKLLPIIFWCLLKCFPECSALSLCRETLRYTTFCSMQCRPTSCFIYISWIFPLHLPKRNLNNNNRCRPITFLPSWWFYSKVQSYRFSAVCFHFWISLFSSVENRGFLTCKCN